MLANLSAKIFSLLLLPSLLTTTLIAEPVEEMNIEAYESLELPQMPGVLRYENDHQLTQMLVQQTQAQLEDFERLLEEYERFCELEERFAEKPQDRELAKKMMKSATALETLIQKRHLDGLFSPQFSEQIRLFSQMAQKHQSQTTLPLE